MPKRESSRGFAETRAEVEEARMPLHLDGKSTPGPLGRDWKRTALGLEKRIAELEAALREIAAGGNSEPPYRFEMVEIAQAVLRKPTA